jgi:hypothetical protein
MAHNQGALRGRGGVALVLCVIGCGCLESGSSGHPGGGISSLATSTTVLPQTPTVAAGVRLWPVPSSVVRACVRSQRSESVTVLCPTRLPHAAVGTPPGTAPPTVRVVPFPATQARYMVHFEYSAPYEAGPLDPRNRPARFLHFSIAGGDLRSFAEPSQDLPPRSPAAQPLGAWRLGGRVGMLYHQRPYSSGGGLYGNHFIFIWREFGTEYGASLHGWDDKQSIAVLGSLISALGRVCGTRLCRVQP